MQLCECELARLLIDEQSAIQTVLLREKNGRRIMAIEIGLIEALAINHGLQGASQPRPLTHDLLLSIISALHGQLEKVVINDMIVMPGGSATFLAVLQISTDDGQNLILDSRPSDALALAVRIGCPLFVSEKILTAAGTEEKL